jgi:hypothetical protein
MREKMAIQTFKLELQVDFRDDEKLKIIQELIVDTAKQLVATAALINDGAKPQVALERKQFFGQGVKVPIVFDGETPAEEE